MRVKAFLSRSWAVRNYSVFNICVTFLVSLAICEWAIFEIWVANCSFPLLENETDPSKTLHVAIIADLHMFGEYLGNWLDKLKRESQMWTAYKTGLRQLQPDMVFILGDIIDEGKWATASQFHRVTHRFNRYFQRKNPEVHVTTGNHDVGFHDFTDDYRVDRFEDNFNTSKVKLVHKNGVNFIILNSVALKNDSCTVCRQTIRELKDVKKVLNCLGKNSAPCKKIREKRNIDDSWKYSPPIILQHYPLYRPNESKCKETEKLNITAKLRIDYDVLSPSVSRELASILKPRMAFSGHSHYYCEYTHDYPLLEVTVSSFSWRNEDKPHFLLLTVSPNDLQFKTCHLPRESFQILLYVLFWSHCFATIGYYHSNDESIIRAFSRKLSCYMNKLNYTNKSYKTK